MTKYTPRHDLVKELKLIGSVAEIADSAIDHIGKMLDNLGARDLVYVLAYLSAVFLSYNTITVMPLDFTDWLWGLGFGLAEKILGKETKPEEPKVIDINILAQSLVIAYIVLKIDASDVASAVSKVGTVIGGLKVV